VSGTVRTLKDTPIAVLESLAKATPELSKRYVREILARIHIEDEGIKRAEISAHAEDAMQVRERLYSALGRIVARYYFSLDPIVRVGFANDAMTPTERRVFLNALLAKDEDEVPE